MSNTKMDLKIMSKRVELLEMKIKELEKLAPESYETRLKQVEEAIYVAKEMLTVTEASLYLGLSMSQIYKMTSTMAIPHYKPRGKMVYFDKKELNRWMKKNHMVPRDYSKKNDDKEGQ